MLRYGQVSRAVSDPNASAPVTKLLPDGSEEAVPSNHDAGARDFFVGLEGVSAISIEAGARRLDQQQSGAAREAAEILNVMKLGNEEGVRVQSRKRKPEPIHSAPV
jgi:hypothetical protein